MSHKSMSHVLPCQTPFDLLYDSSFELPTFPIMIYSTWHFYLILFLEFFTMIQYMCGLFFNSLRVVWRNKKICSYKNNYYLFIYLKKKKEKEKLGRNN